MTHKEQVKAELELIRIQSGGVLQAEDVVAYAKDPDTALHQEFEWDDNAAAHQFRLEQARRVIRLSITVVRNVDEERPVPMYVSLIPDRAKTGGGYRPFVDVMTDDDHRAQLLKQALGEFNRVRRKYEHLVELAPIFAAIDRVEEENDDDDAAA
jgi:hypothetical protein